MKVPQRGKVKSRLAKDIGEAKALRVYEVLLEKCRWEIGQVDCEVDLYYHPFIVEEDIWEPHQFNKKLQAKGDLGLKMKIAFEEHFRSNKSPAVIIGSDCYDLEAKHIEAAFEALKKHDVVFGPANDGGYYLLGMNRLIPQLFRDIPWSTDQVLKRSVEELEISRLKYFMLEELIDLDTFADLKESGFPKKFQKFDQ